MHGGTEDEADNPGLEKGVMGREVNGGCPP